MKNDLAVVDRAEGSGDTEVALSAIMNTAHRCALPALRGLSQVQRTLAIARGTMELDRAMTAKPIMEMLRHLAGNELGFAVDKKYEDAILRRAATVALLKGARLTSFDGPEWMIIGGKTYLCKPFYRRMLLELPNVANLVVRCQAHEQTETNTAYVPIVVTLRVDSKLRTWRFIEKDGIDERIAVRVNAGMIVDAILGKAESKALRRIYVELAGEELPDDEADQHEVRPREKQLFDDDGLPANEGST